jgi:hypothetical protein
LSSNEKVIREIRKIEKGKIAEKKRVRKGLGSCFGPAPDSAHPDSPEPVSLFSLSPSLIDVPHLSGQVIVFLPRPEISPADTAHVNHGRISIPAIPCSF